MRLSSFVPAAFALSLAACADQVDDPVDTAPLQLTHDDAALIEGTFVHAGSVVTFDSRVVGPEHALLHLDVNGVTLTADLDLAGGPFSQDGGLGALYADDIAALIALRDAIGATHPELIDSLHGKLLVRHADRMAEAPEGYTLDRRVIDMSTLSAEVSDRAGSCGNDGNTRLPGIGGLPHEYPHRPVHLHHLRQLRVELSGPLWRRLQLDLGRRHDAGLPRSRSLRRPPPDRRHGLG